MADALLLPVCIDRITDGNGDPVSQAAVYVYDAGTTTLKAVYTDRGLTTAAANPIRADALGLLPARYVTTGAYDLLVKNPLGSTDPNQWSTLYSASGLPGALDTTVFISAGERPVMPTNAVATSTYTVLASDYGGVIVADPSGGDQTMTLPDPTGVDDGTIIGFIHAGSGNDVIIEDDGGTLNTLDTPGESILYVCDTTEWKVIATNTALPTISAYGLTLIDDADAATARTTLGLVIGTDVQAYDAELAAIAGLTSASNKIIRFTGSGTAGLLDFLDEDNMASDSATGIPSQQSVKAYADGKQTQGDILDDLNTLGAVASDGQFLVGTGAGVFAWESGATARASLGLSIGSDVQAYDADTLKADVGDALTAGFTSDVYDHGEITSGTVTPAPATGQENYQTLENGGAFTLAVPATSCSVIIEMTNNANAGAVTVTGYGSNVDGDALDTTDGNVFLLYITRCGSTSHLTVKADAGNS